jgi:ATP-binding cassette subfamily B protein
VPLTLIIFALLPIMLLTTIYFNRKLRAAFKACRFQVGEINAQAEDTLLGMRVVQSFANEDLESEKFDKSNRRFLDLKRIQYHSMAGFNSTNRFLNGLMNITVVIAGAHFLSQGRITAGQFTPPFCCTSTCCWRPSGSWSTLPSSSSAA